MKTYTKDDIKKLLETRDDAVIHGLKVIYSFQTQEEQSIEATNRNNGRGFNGTDATILSNFVTFYEKRGFLSPKQMIIARKKMLKYSSQIAKYVNEKNKLKLDL